MAGAILVPLDGSALAERALPYAITVAGHLATRLRLLRAVPPPVLAVGNRVAAHGQAISNAAIYLAERAVGVVAPIPIDFAIPPVRPVDAIVGEIARGDVTLVVMATHGRTCVGRIVFGSVSDSVVRRVSVPVLLIPPASPAIWPTRDPVRLLVPLDGSELTASALVLTDWLAGLLTAEIFLVHVVNLLVLTAPDGTMAATIDPVVDGEQARPYLEGIAARLRARGHRVHSLTDVGRPDEVIPAIVEERAIQGIVLATHGRGGLSRLILGSVATSVIQRVRVPILITHPGATAPGAIPPDSRARGPRVRPRP